MAIYVRDKFEKSDGNVRGTVAQGDVIVLDYRMAGSITTNGMTYKFTGYNDAGKALYKKTHSVEPTPE